MKPEESKKCEVPILSHILRGLLFLFLFPISLSCLLPGKILNLNVSVYTKGLDKHYVKIIKSKIEAIFKKHNHAINFEDEDYHKILIYHSYDCNEIHRPKLMNYVALYGFMRVMALLFNMLFLILISMTFPKTLNLEIIIIPTAAFFAYVSYLGYLKFYRRYTQENLMILLLEEDTAEEKS